MDRISLVAAILTALAMSAGGWYLYQSEQAVTENAVEVDGVVVSSDVHDREPASRQGDYHPSITYEYTYGGETYTSDNICPGSGSACYPTGSDRGDVVEFVDQYPEGESVTVYVPEDDPEKAFLVDESSSGIYLGLVALGALLIVGVVRKYLKERSAESTGATA